MENLENKKEKVIFDKERTCDYCKKITLTSNFGECYFCKECYKAIVKLYKNNKRKKRLDIILQPHSGFIATYSWKHVIILNTNSFRNICIEDLVKTLSHEFIHHVIYRVAGIKACYQFDNLKYESDVYNAGVEYEE